MVERGSDRLLIAESAAAAHDARSDTFDIAVRRPGLTSRFLFRSDDARAGLAGMFSREMEEGRGFLWLPVCFGIGILAYFALPREPSVWALVALVAGMAIAVWRGHDRGGLLRLTVVLAFVASGALTMKVRTDWVLAPKLSREMSTVVTGWIAERELAARGGVRVIISVHDVERLAAGETPRSVRVTVRSGAETLSVGDGVSVTARIRPPNGPVMPGGYDFARAAFYEGVGGVGFAYGAARPADIAAAPLSIRLGQPLADLREAIRRRVMAALPGDAGRIATALVTGDQGGISETTLDAMRVSGLGHILAISGLHMVLIAGSAFWLIRALLALSPELALNYPIKKWAAVGALGVATFYLGISGAHVATQRAYIMLAIMLAAVLLDRRAITLRNVALAALVVLVIAPESVLTASFQMSFAATIALVAAYEEISSRTLRRPRLGDRGAPGITGRAWRFMAGLFVTSLVAGMATTPFAIYHFHRAAPLTLLANMLAMPAVAVVVMPMALAAVVLMPFGLETIPLAIMSWGLDWVVGVAAWTSDWSGRAGGVRMVPAVSLLLVIVGFLWLSLWRERWRLLGVVPILAAIPLAFLAPLPDVLIDGDGATLAVRGANGRLSTVGQRGSRFAIEYWLRADADLREPDAPDLGEGALCDPLGCTGKVGDDIKIVSLVLKASAFAEDCHLAAIVVSRLDAPDFCRETAVVVDRGALRRKGAHALYRVSDEGAAAVQFRVTTAYPSISRPWMAAFNSGE